MLGSEPVTGKMPVPQVLLLKWKHYIVRLNDLYNSGRGNPPVVAQIDER